jgi:hypothetical protein
MNGVADVKGDEMLRDRRRKSGAKKGKEAEKKLHCRSQLNKAKH